MTTKYFIRKLTSLGYPEPENFDVSDNKKFRFVVCWLENRFICHYDINDRKSLNDTIDSDWPLAYDKYLESLNVPFKSSNMNESLDWLLGLAIQVLYRSKDKKMDFTQSNPIRSQESTSLDNLDLNSEEFKDGVYQLAAFLGVPRHPDHKRVLKACSLLIVQRLSEKNCTESGHEELSMMSTNEISHAINDNNNIDIKQIAASLRLIHIYNLRLLQTNINSILVAVQEIVANPKTNEKLGKVGY